MPANGTWDRLTPRELEVAKLLVLGYTNQEIGIRLEISIRTAEMHRANAMRKTGAAGRSELVRWAYEKGLIELNDELKDMLPQRVPEAVAA